MRKKKTPPPPLPTKRRLVFDTPPADDTKNIETDPNFPRQWKIAGDDVDVRVQTLRDAMRAQGHNPAQNALVDPSSKFRTEYRRILTAHSIITDAILLKHKEIKWFKNATKMMANDIDALHNRRDHLDKKVEELKEQLEGLDASVGILKSQQLAVKSVLDLREDEYMGEEDEESSLPDEYKKFGKISKLCEVALKSYDDVKKRTEQLQKALITATNQERRQRESTLGVMEEKERERVEALDDLLQDFSLEQLRELRDRMRIARGDEWKSESPHRRRIPGKWLRFSRFSKFE